jgi:hypothetical protein
MVLVESFLLDNIVIVFWSFLAEKFKQIIIVDFGIISNKSSHSFVGGSEFYICPE